MDSIDKPALADIRLQIDALDAQLRTLLLARSQLVRQVAEIKAAKFANTANTANTANATNKTCLPIRPWREAQQMAELVAWQRAHAPDWHLPALLAIWREIIGVAIAQQGGLIIYADATALPLARAHFGTLPHYEIYDEDAMARNMRAGEQVLAVVAPAHCFTPCLAPRDDAFIFARLSSGDKATAFCYGRVFYDSTTDKSDDDVTLIRTAATRLPADGIQLATYNAYSLVEIDGAWDAAALGRKYGDDVLWLGVYPRPLDVQVSP